MAGRKIFVGSLPSEITDSQLRSEFARFGTVEEVFIKDNCERSRQWAFITFSTQAQAQQAKEACDRTLQFPGTDRPCDVMLAKNQGMFGQGEPGGGGGGGYGAGDASAADSVPKKIFVGSLPDGMQAEPIRAEFSKYGSVEDVFVKPGCEPGRQWSFVSFATSDQAASAAELTNGVLMFPGSLRPCEVTLARNQGMFGQGSLPQPGSSGPPGPKKCFVGTLPDSITADMLRSEFGKWGQVSDIYLKENCDPGRKWGFITFASPEQAIAAKQGADRVLMFPGADKPCEVTIAKHQGMFGQDGGEDQGYSGGGSYGGYAAPASAPCKVFVGSLPDGCEENLLRAELSKYGHITDVFLKPNCEPSRQWAFVTFASGDQAQRAKDACDRQLVLPNNGDRVCEVMLAKNQGKFGEAPLDAYKGGGKGDWPGGGGGYGGKGGGGGKGYNQPPPPSSPPPPHLTPWRMYKTASGLPYYHNENSGETVWDPPADFQPAGSKGGGSWGKGDGGWSKGGGDGGWGKGGGDGGWGKGCGDGGWGKGCGDGKGGCGAYGGGCGGGGCGDGGMKGGSRYGPY